MCTIIYFLLPVSMCFRYTNVNVGECVCGSKTLDKKTHMKVFIIGVEAAVRNGCALLQRDPFEAVAPLLLKRHHLTAC